jgi:hypothetical protein
MMAVVCLALSVFSNPRPDDSIAEPDCLILSAPHV